MTLIRTYKCIPQTNECLLIKELFPKDFEKKCMSRHFFPFIMHCRCLVWLFDVKSNDSITKALNRHRRCRLTDVVDVDLPMSTTSIQGVWNNPFRFCCKLFCYMNAEGCFYTTCAPCASHFAHPAHNISFLQRVLFRAECPSLRVQTPWVLQHHSLTILNI